MNQLIKAIIAFLEANEIVRAEDHEVYAYGLDTILYTMISTLGLVLIGVVMRSTTEALVIIGMFYINQTLGGGFHASTHLMCFLTMAVGLLCCLSTLFIPFPLPASLIIALMSMGFMLRFPLVLHINKAYLSNKRKLFSKHSQQALIFQLLAICFFLIWRDVHMVQTIAVGLLSCAFSRAVAVVQQKRAGRL